MTPALKGAIAGAIIGFGGFMAIRRVAAKQDIPGATPEQRKMADILRKIAVADLIIFTVVGYFIGPLVMS